MTYIVVEGVIGVGKTALTRLLATQFSVPAVLEQYEENPFLTSFYADRARYSFQTETFFLLNRFRQQQAEVKPALDRGDLVSDYLFAKTKLFAGLNLGGDEVALFDQIYDALSRQVARPSLVVYLRASLDTLMARIYQRDRSFERSMDPGYIMRLSELYSQFFSAYTDAQILEIETDDLDVVRDPLAQRAVIERIRDAAI